MAQVSSLAVVESTTRRLRARLQQLDSIGLHATTNRSTDAHGHPHLRSFTTSVPYPSSAGPQEPASASAKKGTTPRTATPQPTRGGHQDPMADPLKSLSRERHQSSEERAQDGAASASSVRPSSIDEKANHERLVQSVMRDFGFDFSAVRRIGRNERQQHSHAPAAVDRSGVARTVQAVNERTTTPIGVTADDNSAASPAERLPSDTDERRGIHRQSNDSHHPRLSDTVDDNHLQDVSSVGGVNDLPTTILMEDDELPRPRTPPRPHRAGPPSAPYTATDRGHGIVQRPDVLVVSGFDDPSDAHAGTGTATADGTSFGDCLAARGGDRGTAASRIRGGVSKGNDDATALAAKRLSASPLGPPTFASAAIADLLATTRASLTAAKRDELFAVAQRAYEGIVGAKGTTSALYRKYPNICRESERSLPPGATATSLKSADDVFASIVAHTTMQHRMGNTISDQRAVHRSLVVPGGCSAGAAEAIAKRLGRMGQVLRVMPAAGAARSGSARRAAASRSPPRWPRRVVSTPFVTDSLSANDRQVRHVSAPRRAQHPSAVRATRSGTQPPPRRLPSSQRQ